MSLHATYPTADDLRAEIKSLGVLNPATAGDALDAMDLAQKVADAAAEWEEKTGWEPSIEDAADVVRYFDPPGAMDLNANHGLWRGGGKILDLTQDGSGLLELTSLVVGYSATSPGTALTINQDFYLWPYNAPLAGRPYELILFVFVQTGPLRSIRITGKWGLQQGVPDDVWGAILCQALHLCYPALSLRITRGLAMVKELQSEVRYATGSQRPLAAEAIQWKETFRQAVKRHKRIVV